MTYLYGHIRINYYCIYEPKKKRIYSPDGG